MKKIYLSIIASAFMLSANAQLSLTKAFNEPVLGDLNTKPNYDSAAVLPKNTGTNQLWDVSALTTNTVVDVSTYTSVASTPNGAAFTGATLAESDGQGGYTYSKSTATQYEIVGVDQPGLNLNFNTNTAIAAIWPVSYGYTNTDLFSGTATANGTLTGTASGTVTTNASGSGTLIIPGGASFTNVLQVKAQQIVNVSLAFGFVTATVTAIDYNYYHASQKFPILTISYNNIQGSFSNTSGTVKVNGAVITGVNDLNFDATFSIFPNPAKNNFNVNLQNVNNANCKVEIVNAYGAIVKSIDLGYDSKISNNISISDLSSGIYFVKTTLGDKTSARKLIIE